MVTNRGEPRNSALLHQESVWLLHLNKEIGSHRVIPIQMRLVISLQGNTGSVTLFLRVIILSHKMNAIHPTPEIVNRDMAKADFQAKNCPASRSAATRKVVDSRSSPAPRKSTLTPRYLSAFSLYGNADGRQISRVAIDRAPKGTLQDFMSFHHVMLQKSPRSL